VEPKCPNCGAYDMAWGEKTAQIYCGTCGEDLDFQAVRDLGVMFSATRAVALLERGILAMNGRARIGWADEVRNFLAEIRPKVDLTLSGK
jgi:uncharacterized protein (DUF983 family)